ncbi:MAG TPA: helix-turn-helix transcriptional regulator [Acidimicrobiales bacterium]|nr:helix-turn-helix transcriptional regulator [Acidimicrobiales bacterium]
MGGDERVDVGAVDSVLDDCGELVRLGRRSARRADGWTARQHSVLLHVTTVRSAGPAIHPTTLGVGGCEVVGNLGPMRAAEAGRARARSDVVRAVHRGLGLEALTRSFVGALRRVVPFEGTCLLTVDPTTLLPTGEIVDNGLPPTARIRLTEIELREPDFNKFTALARADVPAASLSGATGGQLDRSARQRDVRRPYGFGDELRCMLRGPTGTWGSLTLLREAGRPAFTPVEVRFVASLAAPLADGVRQATLLNDVTVDGPQTDTGFLLVAPDGSVELANDAAQRWLDELTVAGRSTIPLPMAVRAVVTQARHVAEGGATVATARVRSRCGRWVVVRGSTVGAGGGIAVLIEPARPAEQASAFADIYGLTERERTVTELVARGLSTKEIANRLHVSAYTVQDHLKAIFDKTGATSRGALVAQLFLEQHLGPLTDAT